MSSLGGWEWVILAVVALVLFGGGKLAGFGKNAGRAIREFKEETRAAHPEPGAVTPGQQATTEPTVQPVVGETTQPPTEPTTLR